MPTAQKDNRPVIKNFNDLTKHIMLTKLEDYIKGKISSVILKHHTNANKAIKKVVKEETVDEGNKENKEKKKIVIDPKKRDHEKLSDFDFRNLKASQHDKKVNELSTDLLSRYKDKANQDADKQSSNIKIGAGIDKGLPPFKRLVKRENGIGLANKKISGNIGSDAVKSSLDNIPDENMLEPIKPLSKPKLKVRLKTPPPMNEEFPTNSMGTSSSTSGTGPVDTFDPMLFVNHAKKRKELLARRKKQI